MVNVGEIAIFRRTGLQPVFFGETLVGTKLPNLTYMLVFDDMAAHDKNWAKFIGDPEWNRLSTTPCYTNAEILTTSPAYSCGQRGIRRFDWSADCLVRAFWAVVTARASVGVLVESLARMDASLVDVRNRLDVGLVPPSDVLSIEAQRARQQMLLIRARNTFEQTLTDLRYLTGQAPGAPIEILARLEEPRSPAPTTTGTLLADALTNRPERGAMTARIEGTEQRLQAALANRRPVIGLGAGVDYARPNTRIFPRAAEWNPSWDVSVNLTWTLWDGGKVKAETAEVTAAQRAARERLADFDARLAADITRSTLEVDSARAVVTATDEAVRAATEARRVVGERFDAGVATSTEVLDAQVALLQAQLDRTQALAVVRLAEARLDWALGR